MWYGPRGETRHAFGCVLARTGMERDQLIELVPHYLAMLALVFGVLFVIRSVVGNIGFWPELAVVIVVVFLYRPIVSMLGVAPEMWTEN